MRWMRSGLLAVVVLWATLVTPGTASAQEAGASVRLTLRSQTPWNASYTDGGRTLDLSFRAENLGDAPIDHLSVGITLYGRLISRTALEQALTIDPGFVVDAETVPREGTIEPGRSRDFTLSFALDSAGISTTESGVYPLKIDLRSGFTSLAALRTPVIFLVRQPIEPLSLSWTFVVHEPIAFDPDGVFTSNALETALAPGGRTSSEVAALRAVATAGSDAVDVAISPVLLAQLERMRDGYRVVRDGETIEVPADGEGAADAARTLTDLRHLARAPSARIGALPFAVSEIPSLLAGGLGRDVQLQLERGNTELREALGVTPTAGVFRPPGAALDDASVRELVAAGVSTVLVGPSTIEAPSEDPLGFAGPPTAALNGGSLDAIVPDAALTTMLQSPLVDDDPVLGAQVMLGELASIWQEEPSVARGVALVSSEDLALPGPFFAPFTRGVASAPFLHPMHAAEFVDAFPPKESSPLTPVAPRLFSPAYVDALRQARRRVETLRSMLTAPSDTPDRYDTLLLYAESRQFLSDPDGGLAFITAVRDAVGRVFGAISVTAPDVITLTSSNGSTVPVTVTNASDQALRVGVTLRSPHLREEPSLEVDLGAGESKLVTFVVDVRSTGRFTIDALAVAPGGRPIAALTFTVRSTVYNRVALLITVAAALVLAVLWARRLVARLRS